MAFRGQFFLKTWLSITENVCKRQRRALSICHIYHSLPSSCRYFTLKLFCAKKRSNKHQIFERWDDFENRPSCKDYSPCKSYSLWKMVSLGQKLKMPKTWDKPFCKNIRVVCAKNRSRKHQILEKWDDFENRPSWKGYSPCKGYILCKMVSLGQKLKMPKTFKKSFCRNIRLVLCKKPLEKTPNIREMGWFWKWAILQRL